MHWRKISGLVLLGVGLAASAVAAPRATLADAAEQRDRASVRTLLETGADVNAAQVDGTTALHWAAYNDDAETAALLVRAGANVNAVNRYGVPPLAQACTNGNAAIVKLLAGCWSRRERHDEGRGIRPHAGRALRECRSGEGAACARRQPQRARTARPDGPDVGRGRGAHGGRPRAASKPEPTSTRQSIPGFTPFFFAVREGHLDTVRAFLAAGVDVNAMMQRSQSAPGRGGRAAAPGARERRAPVPCCWRCRTATSSLRLRWSTRAPIRTMCEQDSRRSTRLPGCESRIRATSAIPRRRPVRAACRALTSCAKS